MKIDRNFNEFQLRRLKKLYNRGSDYYYVDLHIHTNYSADGTQTFKQAYSVASECKMDIISYTDYDSIGVYKEISEKIIYANEGPIIIPGIEFTVSVPFYSGRCHVLKYFFDENNNDFNSNLGRIDNAYERRIDLWFERIKENNCLQYFANKYDIAYSKKEYHDFLGNLPMKIPEYTTLMNYIFTKLDKHHISVWDVYYRTLEDNKADPCKERQDMKSKLLGKFYYKYQNTDIAKNYRKLRPILAPVGVDDSLFPDYPSEGSLSIIEYGQINIGDLEKCGFNIWAHPDVDELRTTDKISEYVKGYELNYRSEKEDNVFIESVADQRNMIITRGSDTHNLNDGLYHDKDFYRISRNELKAIIELAEGTIV